MLQDCGSTRTIRANALYKWKGLTLSLRADPNLTYFRFRNCYGCRPLSCSNGRKWTCGKSVNLHIRKTKCPTALAAPCARVVWIPHFHPMAFVPNAEHKRERRVDRVPTRRNFVRNFAQRRGSTLSLRANPNPHVRDLDPHLF